MFNDLIAAVGLFDACIVYGFDIATITNCTK